MTQVHASVREVAVLQQATQMILSSVDAETVLHHMLLVVRNYFGASRAAVYLVDSASNELYCRAHNGYSREASNRRLRLGKESVAGWAAFTRAPLYLSDVASERRHKVEDPTIQSVLALPLLVRERPVGVLEIGSKQRDAFTNNDIGLLSVFAGQAAIALENSRLYFTDLVARCVFRHRAGRSRTALIVAPERIAGRGILTPRHRSGERHSQASGLASMLPGNWLGIMRSPGIPWGGAGRNFAGSQAGELLQP